MNLRQVVGFIISILAFQAPAFGEKLKCSTPIQSAPLCSENGISMLDDRYPVMGATVSTGQGGVKFVSEFVDKLMESSQSQPIVTVVSTKEEFQQIVDSINKKTNLSNEEKRSRLTKIRHLNYEFKKNSIESARRLNWQQDFFVSQFDSKTGLPLLREVPRYLSKKSISPKIVTDISDSFSACGVKTGEPLKSQSTELLVGTYGGNTAGFPGGLCLLGRGGFDTDEQWQYYAKQVCGDLDRVVKTPSEFLKVGHTDEFMNVIKLPSESEPCNFAIAVASPRKALEVMENTSEEKLFESEFLESESIDGSPNNSIVRVCSSILRQKLDSFRFPMKRIEESAPAKTTVKWIQSAIIPESFAGSVERSTGVDESNPEVRKMTDKLRDIDDLKKSCGDLKQSDLLNLYKNPMAGYAGEALASKFRLTQDAIQKRMDSFKIELKEKLKKALPQCEPQIVDVPYLFEGNYDAKEKSVTGALSLFPNPTNGQMLEKTYLAPKAGNKAIQKSIEETYKKLGVDVKTVDTFFAHTQNGNLHCSTHLLRYCRPRK